MTDTNVFIYAHDPAAAGKRDRAVSHIAALAARRELTVSVQVLNEFYARATRPNQPPALTRDAAARIVRDIVASATVLSLTSEVTLRALQGAADYGLAWWDSLLWATARENGIPIIYTEDLPGMPETCPACPKSRGFATSTPLRTRKVEPAGRLWVPAVGQRALLRDVRWAAGHAQVPTVAVAGAPAVRRRYPSPLERGSHE